MEVVFQIGLHKKDLELLKLIQAFFGGIGVISTSPNYMCAFKVTSLKQILNKIIPHFYKYPPSGLNYPKTGRLSLI